MRGAGQVAYGRSWWATWAPGRGYGRHRTLGFELSLLLLHAGDPLRERSPLASPPAPSSRGLPERERALAEPERERERDLLSRLFERERERLLRSRLLERERERLRLLEREPERLRERLLDLLLLRDRLSRLSESSMSLSLRPLISFPSNRSIAASRSSRVAKQITPSLRFSLCASAKVTSPAERIISLRSCHETLVERFSTMSRWRVCVGGP